MVYVTYIFCVLLSPDLLGEVIEIFIGKVR